MTPDNKYDLSGEYGIGYASNNNTVFYFDIEDYDKIKNYKWRDSGEYMETRDLRNSFKSIFFMQDIILKHNENLTIDHISHNTYDNRKQNLRIGTKADNTANRGLMKNNTSGCTGVYWCNNVGKWRVDISRNKKRYTLGFFEDFNEAVRVRKKAEEEYFGEWSYANSIKHSIELQQKHSDAEAEANKKIAESLMPELIKKQKIDKWDGSVPIVQGSDGATIVDVGSLTTGE